MGGELNRQLLRDLFAELGRDLGDNVDFTVVGGSAGMLTEQLSPARTTIDCDVIRTEPPELFAALRGAATKLARDRGLPEDWLSDQVAQLDVLPSGWRGRRVDTGTFGRLHVWCVGRLDLLAMKVYAGRMQDRGDVLDMKPTAERSHSSVDISTNYAFPAGRQILIRFNRL